MSDSVSPVNLSWWKFFRMMLIAGLIMCGVVPLKAQGYRDEIALASIFLVLWLSMGIFYALRWRALRAELANGVYSETEFRLDPNRLIGPKKVAILWFSCTIFLILALTFASALKVWPYA
jgi:hypothetical protein